MKIKELNTWHCYWFREDRLFTREDLLNHSDSEFIVFGNPYEFGFRLALYSDVAEVFLRKNVSELDPMKDLPFWDYLILNAEDDLASIPYIGNAEKFGLILDDQRLPIGVLMDIKNIYELHYALRMAIYHRDLNIEFYKRITDHIEEEIFVTDEYGFVQFLNPHAEKVCGVRLSDVIGWHVDDMEKAGIISSSITKEVFRENRTCSRMMELHTGKTVLATGIPLYDKNHRLTNVLATSKNLEEMRNVLTNLHKLTSELDRKESEIKELREHILTRENYVMESPAMQQVEKNILKVAPTDATVLIEGESGAGKEVIADLIYKFSSRKDKPFIKINCAMIPEHLLESEFFGYEPGAFTGANRSGKKGKFELADGGTLFLDELGEMPLPLQAKLLEVLQDKNIVRVGGVERIPVDVRIIAATNRDLREMVRDGLFRRDLFYRINVMTIYLEPLRHRTEDIVPLSNLFLKNCNQRFGMSKVFAPSVLSLFLQYRWPGNVRELMHTIEHLVIVSEKEVISVDDVKLVLGQSEGGNDVALEVFRDVGPADIPSLKQAKQELELTLVKRAYETYRSSYKVAEVLGLTQAAVMKILKRNGYHLKNGNIVKLEL